MNKIKQELKNLVNQWVIIILDLRNQLTTHYFILRTHKQFFDIKFSKKVKVILIPLLCQNISGLV